MYRLSLFVFACVCFFPSPSASFCQDVTGQKIEVAEAGTSFHREVIRGAVKLQRDGKMKRADVVRLRVAMLSPAFREKAEDLAVVQMSASGSEAVPIGEDGKVDRGSINWEGLAAFLEKLIPLILMLMEAFASVLGSESYV